MAERMASNDFNKMENILKPVRQKGFIGIIYRSVALSLPCILACMNIPFIYICHHILS